MVTVALRSRSCKLVILQLVPVILPDLLVTTIKNQEDQLIFYQKKKKKRREKDQLFHTPPPTPTKKKKKRLGLGVASCWFASNGKFWVLQVFMVVFAVQEIDFFLGLLVLIGVWLFWDGWCLFWH